MKLFKIILVIGLMLFLMWRSYLSLIATSQNYQDCLLPHLRYYDSWDTITSLDNVIIVNTCLFIAALSFLFKKKARQY